MKAFVRFGPEGSLLPDLAGRWASTREGRVPIPPAATNRLSTATSAELKSWIKLFEGFELEAADPADTELRAPGDLPSLGELLRGATGPSTPADLLSLLTASTVIAQQDDLAYLASLAGTTDGVSKVYSFHPEDWGLHARDASISLCLYRLYQTERRIHRPFIAHSRPALPLLDHDADERTMAQVFESKVETCLLPPALDPARLAQRSNWLVRAWMGLPLRCELPEETHISTYETEKKVLSSHPHLTLFWLFTHALLDNPQRFAEILSLSRSSKDPWIQEARRALHAWMQGERARLGPLRYGDFERIRDEVVQLAPKASRESRTTEIHADPTSVSTLQGQDHPNYPRFMRLFEQLADIRGLRGESESERKALETQLANLVEPAWRLLIDRALAEGSQVPDHHPSAGCGRILARAALASSLEEFDNAIHRAGGITSFGPRRRDELWRAIASFTNDTATQRLHEGAGMFAREAGDWIRTAPKAPWTLLLARDSLATHRFVTQFLSQVSANPVAAPLIVEAVASARRHNITLAIPGIRRVLSGPFTPIEHHHRQEVLWTLAELDPEAAEFFSDLMAIVKHEWEQSLDEDEAHLRSMDLANIVGALLTVSPNHKEAQAIGASLISRFAVALSPRRSPLPKLIYSLWTLSQGIQEGEVQSLAPPLKCLLELRPQDPATALQLHFWNHLRAVVVALSR